MRFARWSIAAGSVLALMTGAAIAQRAGGAATTPFRMTSPAFPDGGVIPIKYSQVAEQVSPELNWTNVPEGTQSFVLSMTDEEFVRNKTTENQVHWVVWNIPGTSTGLPENVPKGPDLKDGSHQISATGPIYRGPGAPATGPQHHYMFYLYALDTKIDVAATPDPYETRALVMKAIQGHVLSRAVYVGLFHRTP